MSKEYKIIRVALDSLGCKLNQAETDLLTKQFTEAGCRLVSPADEADVYILNTCTVTHIADRKSRHWFRLAHRRNPDARLVAIGCYAQRAPRGLAQIEGIDLVLDNEQKPYLLQLLEESGYLSRPTYARRDLTSGAQTGFRTRALVKVQDGCDNFCSYCIVPLVRGREQSLPVKQIIAEIRQRIDNGNKEVVLTGVKIGSYNYKGVNLKGLLEHILAVIDVTRLRLSSLQPQEISPELIALWIDNRLCHHFHLSLQSGSDSVLSRMKRCYSVSDYRQSISLIRALLPAVAITTDIIVGFPGETSAEFEQSYTLCQKLGFARIHVFPYSPRQGTPANRMLNQVENRIKKERSQQMLALAKESAQNFNRQFLGKTMPVLWEQQTDDSTWSGHSDNYIKVYTKSKDDLSNKILPVKLVTVRGDGVWGEG